MTSPGLNEKAAEKRDEQTHLIIGAAIEVHRLLGRRFLEAVYQQALAEEFSLQNIPFEREKAFPISYKNKLLDAAYRADFVCYSEVIVELKAIDRLSGVENAQVINYLKASRLKRALLLNFGAASLQFERLVFNY
jgi:GxxExxY protein